MVERDRVVDAPVCFFFNQSTARVERATICI